MMEETTRYPFDYDALDKGSIIPVGELTEVLGVRPSSAFYSGRQVSMAAEIEKQLRSRGKEVTVATVGVEIHILPDPEASDHNRRLFRKGLRRLRRAHRNMLQVDTGNLTPEQRKEHDRDLVNQGAILAGIVAARKSVSQIYQRKTPGLPARE